MIILIYLPLLFVLEVLVYCLSIGLDYYCKYKKMKMVKSKWIFIRSNYGDKRLLSKNSMALQVFNYIYMIFYLSLAIIDSFIYENIVFLYINLYSIIPYGITILIVLMVLTFLSPVKEEK